jgi:DUF2971 family protein
MSSPFNFDVPPLEAFRPADRGGYLEGYNDVLDRTGRGASDQALLWHYTSQEGFLGILRSKSIWLTHFRYLNDTTELEYGATLAHRVLFRRLASTKGDDLDLLKKLDESFAASWRPTQGHGYFVFCLSEAEDDLPQWRAYSRGNNGYALGFHPGRLRMFLPPGYDLKKCVYDPREQERLIEQFLDGTTGRVSQTLADAPEPKPRKETLIARLAYSLFEEFVKLAATLKTPSFVSENEWRVISPKTAMFHTISGDSEIRCRPGGPFPVPYLSLDLSPESKLLDWSKTVGFPDSYRCLTWPVFRIVCAPSPYPDLLVEAAHAAMIANGLRHSSALRVSGSRTTLR